MIERDLVVGFPEGMLAVLAFDIKLGDFEAAEID